MFVWVFGPQPGHVSGNPPKQKRTKGSYRESDKERTLEGLHADSLLAQAWPRNESTPPKSKVTQVPNHQISNLTLGTVLHPMHP